MDLPLVSVVIPTYNRADAVMRAIESVLNQTYPNVEVIVVDDCGTDDTEQRVRELAARESRVKYHRHSVNSRANVARNTGFELSKGEFVSFLDSDDLFRPEKVARQVAVLQEREDADACVCQIQIFREKVGDTEIVWNRLHGEHPLLRYAANDVVWGTAAPLWRRSAVTTTGPWDPVLRFHQDLDYHLRALAEGVRFAIIPDILEDYHDASSGTISSGVGQRKDNIKVLVDVYERAEEIARRRSILDDPLRERFAATYLWCAIVGARFGEKDAAARARLAGRRLDPKAGRARMVHALLGPAIPILAKLRTGAKPLVDGMKSIGLPYHRWKHSYMRSDLEGKTYDGPIEYVPQP